MERKGPLPRYTAYHEISEHESEGKQCIQMHPMKFYQLNFESKSLDRQGRVGISLRSRTKVAAPQRFAALRVYRCLSVALCLKNQAPDAKHCLQTHSCLSEMQPKWASCSNVLKIPSM